MFMNITRIENQTFDVERALYNLTHGDVRHCTFAGPADGESALKEARDVHVDDCHFALRYPLWHAEDFTLSQRKMNASWKRIATSSIAEFRTFFLFHEFSCESTQFSSFLLYK